MFGSFGCVGAERVHFVLVFTYVSVSRLLEH